MYENIVDKYISKKGASITYSLALPAILLEIVNIKIKLSNKILSLPIPTELFLENRDFNEKINSALQIFIIRGIQ